MSSERERKRLLPTSKKMTDTVFNNKGFSSNPGRSKGRRRRNDAIGSTGGCSKAWSKIWPRSGQPSSEQKTSSIMAAKNNGEPYMISHRRAAFPSAAPQSLSLAKRVCSATLPCTSPLSSSRWLIPLPLLPVSLVIPAPFARPVRGSMNPHRPRPCGTGGHRSRRRCRGLVAKVGGVSGAPEWGAPCSNREGRSRIPLGQPLRTRSQASFAYVAPARPCEWWQVGFHSCRSCRISSSSSAAQRCSADRILAPLSAFPLSHPIALLPPAMNKGASSSS